MIYFSVGLGIIFLMCIENHFFIGPRIIVAASRIYFLAHDALRALLLKGTGLSVLPSFQTKTHTFPRPRHQGVGASRPRGTSNMVNEVY